MGYGLRALGYAMLSSVAITIVTFGLLLAWMEQLAVRPDFGTNGILWVVVSVFFFDIIVVTPFLLITFGIIIPVVFSYHTDMNSWKKAVLIGVILLVQIGGVSFGFAGFSPGLLLIVIAPLVTITALAMHSLMSEYSHRTSARG